VSVPQAHRDHYRPKWRMLAQAAIAAAADPASEPHDLAGLVRAYRGERGWISPTEDRAVAYLGAALVEASAAYATAGAIKARCGLADFLRAGAAALGEVLDRSAPPAPYEAPGRLRLWWAEDPDGV
jgi:hypothetical protein